MRFPLATVAAATPFLLVAPSVAHAQTAPAAPPAPAASFPTEPPRAKRKLPLLGVDLEVSRMLSARTRRTFGGSTFSIGPGIGDIAPSLKGEITPDISLTEAKRTIAGSRNRLFVIEAGPQFRRAYVPPFVLRQIKAAQRRAIEAAQSGTPPTGAPPIGAPTGPPPGAGFGPPPFVPYYGASADALYASVKVPSAGLSKSGFGVGGSVFVGVAIKSRFFVEARVRATTSVKSYNLSRAGLTVGLRF